MNLMKQKPARQKAERLDPFSRELGEAAVKRITFLDTLKDIGEKPDEIECYVHSTAREMAVAFFGWLYCRGIQESPEVLAGMAQHLIEFLYLGFEGRAAKLSKITKRHLSEFITLCEFAVPQEEWDAGINPFDGVRLYFEFLEELGYPSRLPAVSRSLKELRKVIFKFPVQENLSKGLREVQ